MAGVSRTVYMPDGPRLIEVRGANIDESRINRHRPYTTTVDYESTIQPNPHASGH
jgi:hypothetical protein